MRNKRNEQPRSKDPYLLNEWRVHIKSPQLSPTLRVYSSSIWRSDSVTWQSLDNAATSNYDGIYLGACIQKLWRSHPTRQHRQIRRFLLRKLAFLAVVLAVFTFGSLASAQQGDAYLGGGTLLSSSPSSASLVTKNCTTDANGGFLCPEKGGTYLNVGADVIFRKRYGFAFDVNWKASQGLFGGQAPYRPILLDFNGVYQPRVSKKAGLDLFGGIGWQSTRFYSGNYQCSYFSCTNYTSTHHFLVDVGAGVRYYVWGHMFVRPEARFYHILNNTDTSSIGAGFFSNNVVHVGASIGYTIGPE